MSCKHFKYKTVTVRKLGMWEGKSMRRRVMKLDYQEKEKALFEIYASNWIVQN